MCTSGCGPAFGTTLGAWSLENNRIGPDGELALPFTAKGTSITGLRMHHQSGVGGYAGGNGGTVKYKIVEDAGGTPGTTVLGETNDIIGGLTANIWPDEATAIGTYPDADFRPYGETGTASLFFRRFDFLEPIQTEPCQHYWIIVCNTSENPLEDFVSINMSLSRETVWADEICYTHPARCNHRNRFIGDTIWTERTTIREGFTSCSVGNWELYGDEVYGWAYSGTGVGPPPWDETRTHGLSANEWLLRECFVPDKDMQVCRINLFAAQGENSDGAGIVTGSITNAAGAVLSSTLLGSFPQAPALATVGTSDKVKVYMEWRSGDFLNPVTLLAGQTYYMEFEATDDHIVGYVRDGTSIYFDGTTNCYAFPQGYMQESSDGGVTWSDASSFGTTSKANDLSAYLNIYADGINTCLEDCCDCPVLTAVEAKPNKGRGRGKNKKNKR